MEAGKQKIWFDNVQGGDYVQYFFGEVRYKDAFGKNHWTHFCSQFVPTTKTGTPCFYLHRYRRGQKVKTN